MTTYYHIHDFLINKGCDTYFAEKASNYILNLESKPRNSDELIIETDSVMASVCQDLSPMVKTLMMMVGGIKLMTSIYDAIKLLKSNTKNTNQ